MIITLTGANFSASNIGTLSTWSISRVLGSGATYNGPTFVNKGSALSATVAIGTGYELGTDGVSVTMGGTTQSSAYSISGNVITISIGSVTGNVVIKVPTKNTSTGEEDNTGGTSGEIVDVATSADYSITGFIRPDGTTSDNSSYRMTDYINITGYSQLIVHTEPRTNSVSPAVFFDADKNYISGFTAEDDITEQDFTIDIPDGAVYVRSSTVNTAASLKNCSIKGII